MSTRGRHLLLLLLVFVTLAAACSRGDSEDATPTTRAIISTAEPPAPTTTIATHTAEPQPSSTATPVPATATPPEPPATATPEPPSPAPDMTLEEACQVTDAVQISGGGDQDWSYVSNLIIYDERDEQGIYQLYMSQPDGSDSRCLSCSPTPGAPPTDVHKFQPSWHPSGEYFVVQVEKETHPAGLIRTEDLMTEMLLNGVWNDLYIVLADGSAWYKLTDTSTELTDGVLGPVFSPDGSRLMWSHLIDDPTDDDHPWGIWRLMLADVVFDGGVPSLVNARDITPEGAEFVESHVFSPDGETVLVTSDIESQGEWDMDIWEIDLDSGEVRNLTATGNFWEEHATYTPDGEKVVYMSGKPYPFVPFKNELLMADRSDGSEIQLTHFNTEGYPEYTPEQSMTIRPRWNADGTKISVTQQMSLTYPERRLWVLTFAGPCGGGA